MKAWLIFILVIFLQSPSYCQEILPVGSFKGIIIPQDPTPLNYRRDNPGVFLEVTPHPVAGKTEFIYRLPEGAVNGKITLTTLDGSLVKEMVLAERSGKVSLELDRLEDGIYLYNLISDGKLLKTEKLVIAK